ncbi:MAG: DUF1045 domain-containing protein [Roseovarius sp.]
MAFRRYAVYYTLEAESPLARFGAAWLGWDVAKGQPVPHPQVEGLPAPVSELTETPRKYGFHATLKPPFRLAEGKSVDALATAVERLATQGPPIRADGLVLAPLGRFLALVPQGSESGLNGMAAMVVETLDSFRAPASEAELERRRAAGLTGPQEEMLTRWGYPYVMGEFRFHMTLTGKLPKAQVAPAEACLATALHGLLPQPFLLNGLSLVGEGEDGRFRVIHRYAFSL